MAAVHPQPSENLPSGWECRYDPRSGRYYFINHTEHTTTWEDPRLRHPQLQQGSYAKHYLYGLGKPSTPGLTKAYQAYYGALQHCVPSGPAPPSSAGSYQGAYSPFYGSPRTPYRFKDAGAVQVDERLLNKLCLQFLTVDEGHIWQLLKQYHNRENVVLSALLAEGHPRAQTHPMAYEHLTPKLQKQIIDSQPPPVDEAVVLKLHNFFPLAGVEQIKGLLRKHNGQEHDVISALVSGSKGSGVNQSPHTGSPKMKLRYLKLVFPEADEAVLFDVLNNCDNNAQEASTRLTNMGYKKRDTPILRPNNSSQHATPPPKTEVQRPSLPMERPFPPVMLNPADRNKVQASLQEQFPGVARTLIGLALESSNYNEERARQFLMAMTPQDSTRQVSHSEASQGAENLPSSATEHILPSLPAEAPPVPPRSRHPSSSQDSAGDGVSRSRHSSMEKQSIRGDTTREGTPSHSTVRSSSAWKAGLVGMIRQKFKKEVMKFSKATSTQEDQKSVSTNRSQPKGPNSSLYKGPREDLLLKEYLPWKGPDPQNCKGPDPTLCRGPDSKNLEMKRESRAKGPKLSLRRGPLKDIAHHSITSPSGVLVATVETGP
ncbi:uncharacterized protein LOC143248872 isoform X2 [Tachypleus tridentatus]|uniref:uncharacterized protein LOC143248872 isoform X2 n=1 Tax=Tachypleus tridentatus TaxID=6853 RepID=UPI003FD47DDC